MITKENLNTFTFRRWWIRKYAKKIITDPFLQPTEEDWLDYVDLCVEADEVL